MAETVVFVPNVPVYQAEFRSWPGMVGRYIRGLTEKTRVSSSLEAPAPARAPRNRTSINYSTGRLAVFGMKTAYSKYGFELEGQVVAVPNYAIFLHQGTIPHIIRPIRAKMLKFSWKKLGGGVYYFKKVNHPGTAANDFMLRGLKKAVPA